LRGVGFHESSCLDNLAAVATLAKLWCCITPLLLGTVHKDQWKSNGLPLSIHPPTSIDREAPPPYVTYSDYVHAKYPDIKGKDLVKAKDTRDYLRVSVMPLPPLTAS